MWGGGVLWKRGRTAGTDGLDGCAVAAHSGLKPRLKLVPCRLPHPAPSRPCSPRQMVEEQESQGKALNDVHLGNSSKDSVGDLPSFLKTVGVEKDDQ